MLIFKNHHSNPIYWVYRIFCLISFSAILGQSELKGINLTLIADRIGLVPGEEIELGLLIQHHPGYHTYYLEPGIVGVATKAHWSLPSGFQISELIYPPPELTKMFNITAQGYERDLVLRSKLKVPAGLDLGSKIKIKVQVTWMACSSNCHPGQAERFIELPVIESKDQKISNESNLFEDEKRRGVDVYHEIKLPQARLIGDDRIEIIFELRKIDRPLQQDEMNDFCYFTLDGWVNPDEPQQFEFLSDRKLKMTLFRADRLTKKPKPEFLNGILERKRGWNVDKNQFFINFLSIW
jgi:thiol:disulfide interchange protein DsbD